MATAASSATPSRDDFAKMLEESFTQGSPQEGNVVKGTVVAIEKDVAVIDVGAKTEGRVALREFAGPGRQADIKVGDTVEVYLERVENALGEAVLSRDKARREESWGKLETAWSRTSPTTAPSSISAASMGFCTSPTSPGGGSTIPPRCSTSASR